jgi:DNA-binding protein HU-beta
MTKAETIQDVAKATGLSKVAVRAVLDALLSADPKVGLVARCLKKGDKITFAGFGTFSTRQSAARVGRNPRTGEKIKVAKRRYPAFKAGRTLKEAVKK